MKLEELKIFYNRIKLAESQMDDDSILGANIRRILQETIALEAMHKYDANQLSLDDELNELSKDVDREAEWLINQYNRNRDSKDHISSIDELDQNNQAFGD
tara:strand:+ start:199 stop:501 length:303 start_codon:yes stop_codon:yes gene_type:complete